MYGEFSKREVDILRRALETLMKAGNDTGERCNRLTEVTPAASYYTSEN